MGRWSQYDEDSARLPEGMKRIGYDADTSRYIFQDRTGALYESEPGNRFGVLTPVQGRENNIRRARPNAFEPSDPGEKRKALTVNSNLKSFEDFLPSQAITSPPPSPPKRSMFTADPDTTSPTNSLRLPNVFLKVKAMTSAVSRMQASTSDGPRHHNKSPSLPAPATCRYRNSPSPPPLPTRKRRGYSQLPEPRRGGEDTRALLRSKTMSSHASADSSSSRSYQPHPNRTSSRGSRVSSLSTTSTITPMKTS